MKRTLCILLTALLLAALLPAGALAADGTPVISLTHAPAFGGREPFTGVVYCPDGGAFDPADWRVTLYIELKQWGTFWPKPSLDEPCVALAPDGSFAVGYDEDIESDRLSTDLHLLLLPAAFDAYGDFRAAAAAAADHVTVTRAPGGSNSVSPARTAPAFGAFPTSGLTSGTEKLAVNVGLYTQGRPGAGLAAETIRAQLNALVPFADTVRFYAASGEAAPACEIAHTLGLRVIGTAWLSGNAAADRQELDALIAQCRSGLCAVACVGSETLLRGDLTEAQLIADIEYVRAGLAGTGIPITTADDASELLAHGAVRAACDVLMVNCYPYWHGIAHAEAAAYFTAMMAAVRGVCCGRELLVSETGWPTAGQTVQNAVPGEAEAAAYFTDVLAWSRTSGVPVLWFDAADEPWKAESEGAAGAHWGVMDSGLALKDAFARTAFFRDAAARTGLQNFRRALSYSDGVFTDVGPGDWFRPNVAAAYELALMNGMGDGTFAPQGDVKVSEIIAVACRLRDTYYGLSASHPGAAAWYDGYVRYALAADIIREGQFDRYDRPATRAEVAQVLYRALPAAALAPTRTVDAIPDVTGAEPWGGAVFGFYRAGVLNGSDAAGSFAPARPITRAEIAAIVTRIADAALRIGA